jgi:hypothetical protein
MVLSSGQARGRSYLVEIQQGTKLMKQKKRPFEMPDANPFGTLKKPPEANAFVKAHFEKKRLPSKKDAK